jgi:hypothetical protein
MIRTTAVAVRRGNTSNTLALARLPDARVTPYPPLICAALLGGSNTTVTLLFPHAGHMRSGPPNSRAHYRCNTITDA